MGSNYVSLPVIDFSGEVLKPGTPAWNSIKVQVRKVFEEFGCFNALYDKIPMGIRKAFFDVVKEFFDLPYENKMRHHLKHDHFFGYYKPGPEFDLDFENLNILDPTILEKVEESFTNVIWPQGNSNFSKTIQSYSQQLVKFEKTIRTIVFESLGLEKYLDEHMDSSKYFIRLNKYIASQTTETKLGLIAHTDKTILAMLDENNKKGLQILKKDGQWMEVNFSPNSLMVISGDIFHAWTNGRLHSPFHKVMMTGNEARYSVGLFSVPKGGCIVKAPEELVDEEHPQLFKPFDYAKFVKFSQTEDGLKCHFALKAYCGI